MGILFDGHRPVSATLWFAAAEHMTAEPAECLSQRALANAGQSSVQSRRQRLTLARAHLARTGRGGRVRTEHRPLDDAQVRHRAKATMPIDSPDQDWLRMLYFQSDLPLGANPERVVVTQAEGDKKYGDQNTDGSSSIRRLRSSLRSNGAFFVVTRPSTTVRSWPGAAVSGYYFSHPDSTYFGVSEIGQDQAQDYARRKGWTLEEAERWLAPNLGYDPEER